MDIFTYFNVIMLILMILIIIALFLAFLYMVYGSEGEREKEKAVTRVSYQNFLPASKPSRLLPKGDK